MPLENLVAAVMVGGLVLYVLGGGADFGGGVWDLLASGPRKLAQRALTLARAALRPGGSFVTKLFEGQEVNAYVADAKQSFGEVKRVKPDATRDESVELFLVCKGFRPAPA